MIFDVFNKSIEVRCLSLTLILISTHIVIDSLEILWNWRELKPNGVFCWRPKNSPPRLSTFQSLDWIFDYPFCLIIQCMRGGIGFLTILDSLNNGYSIKFVWLLFLFQLYHNGRERRVFAYAYHSMALMILGGISIAGIAHDSEFSLKFGIWFIALQGAFAYNNAGVCKLLNTHWRSGVALREALTTRIFNSPFLANCLGESPSIWKITAWGIIGFELLFPIAIFGGTTIAIPYLILGSLFHLGIAYGMGLHHFFWTFTATYPLIWYASRQMPW